jgi:hypothetical protein
VLDEETVYTYQDQGLQRFRYRTGFLASPTGVGRGIATYEIPIVGRDEWLAAARRLA